MKITHESTAKLEALVSITIEKEDYSKGVQKALKSYAKKANINGFRQGKVPMGMVKKMYGNYLLSEELNNLIQQKLDEYLKENDLRILGAPMAQEKETNPLDIYKDYDYEFEFQLGMAPEVDIDEAGVVGEQNIIQHDIEVTDEQVTDEIDVYRKRLGSREDVEQIKDEDDVLAIDLAELNEAGELKEEGVQSSTYISPKMIVDEKVRKKFEALKTGESLDLNVFESIQGDEDQIHNVVLNLKDGVPENLSPNFKTTLTKITTLIPAALDQAFFDNLFGKDEIKSEEELKTKIKEQLEAYYKSLSSNQLRKEVFDSLIENAPVELPDDFLKKFLEASNEKEENGRLDIDKDYDLYKRGIKWELIKSHLLEKYKIEIDQEDLNEVNRAEVRRNMMRYNPGHQPTDEDLDKIAASMLQDKKYVGQLVDMIVQDKIYDKLLPLLTIESKPISLDDFNQLT